jgi:G3E family GTPase
MLTPSEEEMPDVDSTLTSPFGPVPTVLLVGFLGSGKTTFLHALLPLLLARGMEPYVVINDYQNARIDASSLKSLANEVIPLNGNCVCCDSIHALIDCLTGMPDKPNRVALIEANGTADPFSLIEHLMANRRLKGRFYPLIQLGVIDSTRWQKRAWQNDLEKLQAESASHLFFSRVENTSASNMSRVREDLEWLNPRAVETQPEQLAEELVSLAGAVQNKANGKTRVITRSTNQFSNPSKRNLHQLSHGFVGVQIDLPPQVDASTLLAWLQQLPGSILRVKGVCRLSELPGTHHIFQRTEGSEPTIFPQPGESDIPSCAVLIGVRLDKTALQADANAAFGEIERIG